MLAHNDHHNDRNVCVANREGFLSRRLTINADNVEQIYVFLYSTEIMNIRQYINQLLSSR